MSTMGLNPSLLHSYCISHVIDNMFDHYGINTSLFYIFFAHIDNAIFMVCDALLLYPRRHINMWNNHLNENKHTSYLITEFNKSIILEVSSESCYF